MLGGPQAFYQGPRDGLFIFWEWMVRHESYWFAVCGYFAMLLELALTYMKNHVIM